MEIKNFLTNHFDFSVNKTNILAIIVFLLIIPAVLFLPKSYGYENGLLENIQMIILILSAIYCLRVKENKTFFRFVFWVLTIIMLREINCGRTLFFAVPGVENTFYSWKEIKYGYLVHPIYGIYIGLCVLYFLKNKLYLTIWNLLKNVKFPLITTVFGLIGMFLAMYAEKVLGIFVLEEMAELLLYISVAGIIYTYSKYIEQ